MNAEHRLNLRLIGGSDIAAIVGVSPWATAHDVFARIVHGRTFEPSEPMQWGTRLEHAIGEAAIEQYFSGSNWLRPESMEFKGRFRVTPDYTDDTARIIEVKNTGERSRWEQIPVHYQLQAQWYLHHLDRQVCHFAVLHGGQRLEVYDLCRNVELGPQLERIANGFWERHIATGLPPPADASSACNSNLARAWTPSKEMRVANTVEEELALELERTRAQLDELDTKKRTLTNQLVSLIGDDYALRLTDGRRAVAQFTKGRQNTDWKSVIADLAPYLEAHQFNLSSLIATHTKEGAPTRQVKIYDK